MRGRISNTVDCSITAELPGANAVLQAMQAVANRTASACADLGTPAAGGYVACPSPCAGEDMSAYSGVGRCLACVAEDRVRAISVEISGTPPAPATALQRDCQQRVQKALGYLVAQMKSQQRCQSAEDKGPTARYCLTDDASGLIARARAAANAAIADCDAGALAALDFCADTIADVQSCLQNAADARAEELFAAIYFPSPDLRVRFNNPTGESLVVTVSGNRLGGSPPQPGEATFYPSRTRVVAAGSSELSILIRPAPGVWLHSISVAGTAQIQFQQTLLLRRPATANFVDWRLFKTVLAVNDGGDAGDGICDASCTLRDAIASANVAPAPVLIRFDHSSFPGGDASVTVTNPVGLQLQSSAAMLDGTNADGDPSPLVELAQRTYQTNINLVAPNANPIPGDCPCNESPGGALQIIAAGVEVRGLALRRTLAAEGSVCCGDQDLITFGVGSKNSTVATCRLDGGAAAFTSAEVAQGQTRPPTGKDCVDADNTDATSAEPVVVANSELRFCYDRGVKSRRGLVRLEDDWIHHNLRGGVFAQSPDSGTQKGIIEAANNLVERNGQNCASGDPDNCGSEIVTRSEASELSAQGAFTEIQSTGNVVRNGVLQGFYLQDQAQASLQDDYICGINNGVNGKGVLFESTGGNASDFKVRGTAVVYNDDTGMKIAGTVAVDLGTDGGLNAGRNVFAQNGASLRRNLRNILNDPAPVLAAQGNQWEHCYPNSGAVADACDALSIGDNDTNNTIGVTDKVDVGHPLPHQGSGPIEVTDAQPAKAIAGAVVHVFGSGFDAVSGHSGGVAGSCNALAAGNSCAPLQGTCVEFLVDGMWTAAQDVLGVTPTHLVVRSPLTCAGPTQLRVRRNILGGGEVVSSPSTFCQN